MNPAVAEQATQGPGLFRASQVALVVGDQVVLSGGNFLTMLLLARWLAPSLFGLFVLGFSAILLIKSFHLALVTTPLMSIGGGLSGREFEGFRAALLRAHAAFTGAVALILSAGALLLGGLLPQSITIGVLALAVAATYALLWQEFVRRSLLAAQRRSAVLLNDAVRFGVQLPALVLLHSTERLSVGAAFGVIALGSLAAVLLGIGQLAPGPQVAPAQRRAWYGETLDFGKWLACTCGALWLVERWYFFGVAALMSTREVGVLAACVTLLNVSNIFFMSFENHAIPALARRMSAEGPDGVYALFARLLTAGGICFGIGCAVLAALGEPLLVGLFGSDYAGYGWFVGLVALQSFVAFFARMAAIALKIVRRSREMFRAYALAGLVTLGTSMPLIARFGLAGAGAGQVLTQLALAAALLFWLFIRVETRPVALAGCDSRS